MENRHRAGIVRYQCRDSPGTLSAQLFQFWCSLAVTLLEIGYVQLLGECPHCVSLLLRPLTSSDPEYQNVQKILFHLLYCQPTGTAI